MSFFRAQNKKEKETSIKSTDVTNKNKSGVSKDENIIPTIPETHENIKHLYPDPLDNFRSDDPWSRAYESHSLKI